MNDYIVIAVRATELISFIFSFLVGTYVFYKKSGNFVNLNFGLLAAATCFWTFSVFMLRGAPTPAEGIFWAKFTWSSVVVLQVIALNFSLRISNTWEQPGISPITKLVMPFAIVLLGLLIGTDLIVAGTTREFFGITRIKGSLFFVYSIYFVLISLAALFFLLRRYLASTRLKQRHQLGYAVIGMAFPIVLGGLTQVLLPLLGIEVLPLGSLGLVIGLGFFAVAILKYGLMTLSLSTATTTILSAMSEAVLLVNPEGKIKECNNSFLNLTGFSRGEVINSPLALIFKNEALINRVLNESAISKLDLFISGKTQEKIEVAVSSSALADEFGEKFGITIVAYDVRETKNLIRELEAAKNVLEQKVAERTAELKRQRDTLEEKVRERTADLEAKLDELNAFHDAAVGRELRMIEMEKELDALRIEVTELKSKR